MANKEVANTEANINVIPYSSREASAGLQGFGINSINCSLKTIIRHYYNEGTNHNILIEEWFSLSYDEIDQSQPSLGCYLN